MFNVYQNVYSVYIIFIIYAPVIIVMISQSRRKFKILIVRLLVIGNFKGFLSFNLLQQSIRKRLMKTFKQKKKFIKLRFFGRSGKKILLQRRKRRKNKIFTIH